MCVSRVTTTNHTAHTLERVNKFTDQVTHTPWQHVTFSSNGNYVIGCPADTNQHTINVWDREKGVLTKIMEGPKEHIRNVQWHPIRPVLVAISNFGSIHVWTVSQSDNWSAFAPDFKEIEENVEYEEREDEFDFVRDAVCVYSSAPSV
ncbi:hypothetical protein PTSG_07049 [Salpingoeca rosetta]|uniref:Uncharacterized protein n=1 Tax=Salpingoeca rosetta (strain ATCC 50818 / BSB-021) TaxID=946362 RepID=F2UDW5_SALR5|nr:uncharacterized protein PTSG_07049 [Salpingoeca rosetta]EGD74815.1 hypothetical protein PTSG_07049 [Salpingoeca rosetta]|eukprot:XP_004992460.1 hypothetical protein PTSG_07049 [Salpingoeca rosetta]